MRCACERVESQDSIARLSRCDIFVSLRGCIRAENSGSLHRNRAAHVG